MKSEARELQPQRYGSAERVLARRVVSISVTAQHNVQHKVSLTHNSTIHYDTLQLMKLILELDKKMLSRLLTLSLGLLALPLAFANPTAEKLAGLAAKNGGVIKLDPSLYELITGPDREWNAVVQLTAMGDQFKCAPCR